MSSNIKIHHKLHLKAIVTFKGGWGRLYYTQHTLLSNVRQSAFFLRNKYTHSHKGEEKRF